MTKTYAQLTREIQALQASAEKLRAAEIKAVIAKINESIAQYELTVGDLRFPGTRSSAASASRPDASTDAKYSDGEGHTWGGRGPRPAWLRQALASGRSLESFETAGTAASVQASTPADGKGRSAKGAAPQARVKLPPLYGHPKTGQAWSGRGPKPTWLKQALKKRGAVLDDFLLVPAAASASTSAPSPSPATAKPAATPRAAAAKSAPSKAGSRRKASTGAKPEAAAKSAAKAASPSAARKAPAAKKAKAAASPSAPKAPAKKAAKPSIPARAAPRKNLPASMAPSADAAPTPSTVPTAAPLPATPSAAVEGQGDTAAS